MEEADREKLKESESVCECNSLPLSNPREFTDCRGEEREWWRGVGEITAEKEIESRNRGRRQEKER